MCYNMGVRKESERRCSTHSSRADGKRKGPERQREWGSRPGPAIGKSLYRQIAALASALGRIERELQDSQNWLHETLCDCDQCLYELRRQRQLLQARAQLLAELEALNAAVALADVETECVRCAQPFTPIDDEQAVRAMLARRERAPSLTGGAPAILSKGVSTNAAARVGLRVYDAQAASLVESPSESEPTGFMTCARALYPHGSGAGQRRAHRRGL
jgi:hypothetical protein